MAIACMATPGPAFAGAPPEASLTVDSTSAMVNETVSLGIELVGFTDEQKLAQYQVTLKFVDADGVEQSAGELAAEPHGTALVAGYSSYSASKLGFTGSYAQVAAALASVTWSPSAAASGLTLRIGVSTAPGENQFYDANSGHYYEYVPYGDDDVRHAPEAFVQARTRTLFGMTGYLAHITSRAENDFVANETAIYNIWIGATDSAVEGEWRWAGADLAGESDIVFGTYDSPNFVPRATAEGFYGWYPDSGRFAGWAWGEPNNYDNNEDYVVTNWNYAMGEWNDLRGDDSWFVNGYLVEYGGAGGTSTALSITQDVELSSIALPQTVTWSPSNTQVLASESPLTPSSRATTTGSGEITYSVRSAGTTGCSVDASTAELTFTAAGSCVIRATASATSEFAEGWSEATFQIGSTETTSRVTLGASVGDPAAGASATYSFTGMRPGSSWSLILRSTPQTLASGTVAGTGSVAGSTTIPAGLEPGWHSLTLSATSLDGAEVTSVTWFELSSAGTVVRIQAVPPSAPATPGAPPTTALAATGGPMPGIAIPALLVIALGMVLVASRRRRNV